MPRARLASAGEACVERVELGGERREALPLRRRAPLHGDPTAAVGVGREPAQLGRGGERVGGLDERGTGGAGLER